jgi:preprotein translocase subunit SecE
MIDKIVGYLKEVVQELKKVTWPSKQELIGSTSVVLILSTLVALFLFLIDNILARVTRLLF